MINNDMYVRSHFRSRSLCSLAGEIIHVIIFNFNQKAWDQMDQPLADPQASAAL
jgi:hypothetical protein